MYIKMIMDTLPYWGVFLLSFLLIFASVELGIWLGSRERSKHTDRRKVYSRSSVNAALVLLAFMLAITFSITNSRFDERKHLVLDEANAIGTAFIRADILAQPERDEVRCLLKSYVSDRLQVQENFNDESIATGRRKAEEIHNSLWRVALRSVEKHPDPLNTLLLSAINDVIDKHQSRVTVGIQLRMPGLFWMTLYSLIIISMIIAGIDKSVSGARRSNVVDLPVVIAFTLVLSLVVLLDRPDLSSTLVTQEPLMDVLNSMESKTGFCS